MSNVIDLIEELEKRRVASDDMYERITIIEQINFLRGRKRTQPQSFKEDDKIHLLLLWDDIT